MILILSTEQDLSTTLVMEWLFSFGEVVLRINETDEISIEHISISNDSIEICLNSKGITFQLNQIKSYWYRRGELTISRIDSSVSAYVKKHLEGELITVVDYIHFALSKEKYLGSYFNNNQNKLINLELARESGLMIPNSLISMKRSNIINFINNNHNVITKAIRESVSHLSEKGYVQAYTSKIFKSNLSHYNEEVFPSLVQIEVKKLFELRIFFLDDTCYPMAIFSQQNEQTSIDFRKYSTERPNRCVPYQLPKEIEHKISTFMKAVRLNTGSIDMVVTPTLEYVFLEVNPIGQYGMTSFPCNYNLDFKIAEFLCKTK